MSAMQFRGLRDASIRNVSPTGPTAAVPRLFPQPFRPALGSRQDAKLPCDRTCDAGISGFLPAFDSLAG